MFKRKKRAQQDTVEVTNFATGDKGDTVYAFCDICGGRADVETKRCERHAGPAFARQDPVRGEYETRGDAS